MIYTVTLNPAIDYNIKTDGFEKGKIIKYSGAEYFPGGKGINVSLMLSALMQENTAVVAVAGFSGAEIINTLNDSGCSTSEIWLESGHSRINYKVCDSDGTETDFNGSGPDMTDAVLDKVVDRLAGASKEDFVVLAGSLPDSLSHNAYEKILEKISKRGAKLVIDAVGDVLRSTLRFSPFLLKPNRDELSEFFNTEIKSIEEAEKYAKELIALGAQNVVVSLGEEGAILVNRDNETLYREAVRSEVISTVGAGDSLIAGFIYGYNKSGNLTEALKCGVAAGCATTFSLGIATRDKFEETYLKCK